MAFGAGVCSAVAMFSIVFGTVLALPLFYLAPLPLYLAGFGIGVKGALMALAAAVVTAGLIGGAYIAIPMALAYGVPVLMATQNALRSTPSQSGQVVWTPVGQIVGGFTAIGVAGLFFMGLVTMMDASIESLSGAVNTFIGDALNTMASEMPADARATIVGSIAPYFPGMAVASWIIMHVVNAAAAQSALVKSGRNIRPQSAYTDMVLPDWCSWVLVISGVIALALPGDWSYLGHNLVIVALVPFFLAGLAVVHSFARRAKSTTLLLVSFYIIILVLGWAAFVVASIGIIEQWFGLRSRLLPNNRKENE